MYSACVMIECFLMHGLRNMWKTGVTHTDLRTQGHIFSLLSTTFNFITSVNVSVVALNCFWEGEKEGTDVQQRSPAGIEPSTVATMQPCAVTIRLLRCSRIKFYRDE